MLNTKLILVDGITGSGKSTTAHFIARQMEKNGIKVRWIYEQEKNHPLNKNQWQESDSVLSYSDRLLREDPKVWMDFVNTIKHDDCIYIVEAYWFQDVLMFPHFANDLNRQIIKDFSHQICDIIRCLNPVIIHFYQQDVGKSLQLTWERRGAKEWYIEQDADNLYCANRGLKGEVAVIKIWQDFSDFTLELFEEYDFRKLQIENSAQDWELYHSLILDFLQISKHEEVLYDNSFLQFCGLYLGEGYSADVYTENQNLWIYIPNFGSSTRLIPIADNEFAFESYQITIRFAVNERNEIQSLEFIKALGDFQGGTAEKFQPYKLSEAELNLFSGDYRCETENLDRKIYQKDCSLYYVRGVNNVSRLLPISNTKLVMGRSVSLDFDLTNNPKQFVFKAKGQEDSVFIQNHVHHNNHTNHSSDN